LKLIIYIRNILKKLFTSKKKHNAKNSEIDEILVEMIKMNDTKNVNVNDPISKIIETTKQEKICWDYCNNETKVKLFDLLANNFYKEYDFRQFKYYEVFKLKTERKDIYLSKIHIPNATYVHLSFCEKNLDGIIIDYSNWSGPLVQLFDLVKNTVTDEVFSSL
jgi:hypothetical protein